ncbi:MFS transporter [Pelagibacterium lentulum]|uniref:MFS transporter n=1 Tax=Pelagibacterium lentulum TaxID=2029865 RepID=A0A916VV58_9HYPH|nr:MFS transporter [Pelagibacterium lentulum]GGA40520.1 MFS transporter [Pelagibacterium lentulum]
MPLLLAPALLFFSNALMHITLFTRLPHIAESAGLNKAELGLALLGMPLGTLLALPIAGALVDRLTPRIAAATMLLANAAIMPLFALSPGFFIPILFATYSFIRTFLDVGQNMVAIGIETASGTSVLSRSHGFWSVGLFAGSLAAGGLIGLGLSPAWHQSAASLTVTLLIAFFLAIAPSNAVLAAPRGRKRPIFAVPDRAVLLVCAMVIGISLTEGTIYDWSMFFLLEIVETDAASAGLVFAAFTIGMGATRMLGDSLRAHLSAATLVRGSACLGAVGVSILLMAENAYVAGLALAILGAGVALNAPIGVMVVSRLPGRSPSDNMAAMSMVMLIATFGVPAGFGFIAETAGLRVVFAILLPFLALSLLLAPVAGRRNASG